MEVSLEVLQIDDFTAVKRWKTDIAELENLQIESKNVLCWLVNYNGVSIGFVYLFHINQSEKIAHWNYYLEKGDMDLEKIKRVLELNLYDYVFDVLGFKEVYCENVCYNDQYCVIKDEWNDIRIDLLYEKINYDFRLKPHHIGYAVADLKKAFEKYRKLGYYQATKIFDDIDRNIRIVFLKSYESGECIELISPLSDECPISGILRQMKNVSSPYHICYETNEFEKAIMVMKQRGFIPTTKPEKAVAFHYKKVIFMISKEAGLIELVEK